MKKPAKKAKTKRKPSLPKTAMAHQPGHAVRNSKAKSLLPELAGLRLRLREAEETLTAIRKGEVDAVVVSGPQGDKVYTLKGAEQPYRILVESMNEGALSLTSTGTIINCNKAFAKIAGTPCGMLIGRSFRDMISKKEREKFDAFWKQAVKKEARTEIELNFSGRTVPTYLSVNARTFDGECWVFAVVTDISKRKRTEAELADYRLHLERLVDEKTEQVQAANEELQTTNEELQTTNEELQTSNEELQTTNEELLETSEQLAAKTAEFQAVFDSMSEAVIFAGQNRKVLMCNPAAERMFGYSREEMIGSGTERLYADKGDYERMETEAQNAHAAGQPKPREIRYRRKDGTVFLGETFDATVKSPYSIMGFVGLHRDITGRRMAEEAIQKTNDELAAANRELDAFGYSVSHDLRAPLRTIEGFSRAILEEEADRLDDKGKDYFRRVRAAVEKMGQLIDALLRLSQSARGALKRTHTDLSAAARAIIESLRRSYPERRVECVITDNITAEGDTVMLRTVLENLLQNAWKYTMKREHAKIEFGAFECGMPNSEFRIKEWCEQGKTVYFVRDNGAGFDMTYANRLFMVFQRLHTVDEFPGLGIGLATVQRVIHRHGGRVWAEGEPDKGATFFFTLG